MSRNVCHNLPRAYAQTFTCGVLAGLSHFFSGEERQTGVLRPWIEATLIAVNSLGPDILAVAISRFGALVTGVQTYGGARMSRYSLVEAACA